MSAHLFRVYEPWEAAWAAGFIDGEGSVRLRRRGDADNYTPVVAVGQVVREPLNRLQELFGGAMRVDRRRPDRWQPLHIWEISGARRVGRVLRAIQPFLLVKARQADLVLEYIEGMRTTEGWSRRALSPAERLVRERIVEALRA